MMARAVSGGGVGGACGRDRDERGKDQKRNHRGTHPFAPVSSLGGTLRVTSRSADGRRRAFREPTA